MLAGLLTNRHGGHWHQEKLAPKAHAAFETARRRSAESGVAIDELLATMQARDAKDSTREDSPLTEAADAVVVDTTGLSIDEVVEQVVELFDDR